ncbi:hypothetical protein N1F89_18830 [Aquibium sp. A9E412]|uniref:hypothetical protein n=1 Tax=Aquibium sp. A9E412 TaxID=2976767 RepID=UPI0025B15B0F|nr:hypothetical protein [Aquibium sp. A9E412]MDN2568284.1 hypothetical protein [Aquibium sp. A9E412]
MTVEVLLPLTEGLARQRRADAAGEAALAAELLVLLRLTLNDDALTPAGRAAFARLAAAGFALAPAEADTALTAIDGWLAARGTAGAAAYLGGLTAERRTALGRRALALCAADAALARRRKRLCGRLAALLDLPAERLTGAA